MVNRCPMAIRLLADTMATRCMRPADHGAISDKHTAPGVGNHVVSWSAGDGREFEAPEHDERVPWSLVSR